VLSKPQVILRLASLVLELHFALQIRTLCGGLVRASPEGPGDDVSGLDASLGEADGDPEFGHVGFVVAARGGEGTTDGLAPRPDEFVMLGS
jgi:hypothetical protein